MNRLFKIHAGIASFLLFCMVFSYGFAWEMVCPHGCCSDKDPTIQSMSKRLFDRLTEIEFLDDQSYRAWISYGRLGDHFDSVHSTWTNRGLEFQVSARDDGVYGEYATWTASTRVDSKATTIRAYEIKSIDRDLLDADCQLYFERTLAVTSDFIGYEVNYTTGLKTPTTRGKIHYAKNGVHIVPTEMRQ